MTQSRRPVGSVLHAHLRRYRRGIYRMVMPSTHAEWTIDMLDALPEDGQRYEIIDGELFVTPAPREDHQLVASDLHGILYEYLRRWPGVGRAMVAPSDVWRGERRKNRVQPDVFVLRLTDGRRPAYPYVIDSLLLAVEVVSPSRRLIDYEVKRDLYLRGGIAEYWVVDTDARQVMRWRGRDAPGEVLTTQLDWQPSMSADPLVIDLARFFEESLAG